MSIPESIPKKVAPAGHYTCAICGGVFSYSKDWTDEDAKKEFEENFAREPDPEELDDVVCDVCYKKVMGEE